MKAFLGSTAFLAVALTGCSLANVRPAPVVGTIGTPITAHITTHNVPDGRCHEDDPCWKPTPTTIVRIGTAIHVSSK
jgi:hypothetical protein